MLKNETEKLLPAKVLVNKIILFIQLFLLGGLAFIMLSRRHFEVISEQLFVGSPYLMGSIVLDVLVRPESIVLLIILLCAVLHNHRRRASVGVKLLIHINVLCLNLALLSLLIYRLYPV